MLDLTILNSGHRHLVVNGNDAVGWLTACGDRIMTGHGMWSAEVKPVKQVRCPDCLREMAAHDY